MKTLQTIGKRPKDIPENWIVMNAPRPLYGHKEWTGEFQHGVFYVALNPDDSCVHDMWMKKNEEQDAWICEYWTKAQAIKYILDYYHEKYPGEDETINALSEIKLLDAFYNLMERRRNEKV